MMKKVIQWWYSECKVIRYLNSEDEDYTMTHGEVVICLAIGLAMLLVMGFAQTYESSQTY